MGYFTIQHQVFKQGQHQLVAAPSNLHVCELPRFEQSLNCCVDQDGIELIACPTCGRIQVDLFSLVQDVNDKLSEAIEVPMKVAVMGCVVNGPGEAEGADVAVFAGDRKGIIYVQGEKVATVGEDEILDRLLDECKAFQERVRAGEVKLGEKKVDIVPPDPEGELGSGWEKMAAQRMGHTPLTIEGN